MAATTQEILAGLLVGGIKSWTEGRQPGVVVISYSFASGPVFEGSTSSALSEGQKAAVREALGAWSKVCGAQFVETREGSIVFARDELDGPIKGSATYPASSFVPVYFDTSIVSNPAKGSLDYDVIVHEIGHALGLSHPIGLPGNSSNDTVMNYNKGPQNKTSPQPYDIIAVQHLYGKAVPDVSSTLNQTLGTVDVVGSARDDVIYGDYAVSTRLFGGDGNDTLYSNQFIDDNGLLSGGAGDDILVPLAYEIGLDGGTGNDTVDLSPTGHNGFFLLRANGDLFNTVDGLGENPPPPLATGIENILLGSSDDEVIGNDQDNVLNAGAGDDSLSGGKGNDVLIGGLGNDVAYYQLGNGTYTIGRYLSASENQTVTIIKSSDGYDLLYEIESVQFGSSPAISLSTSGSQGQISFTPPSIQLSSDQSSLKAGETAVLTFVLSTPVTDFVLDDVRVKGGTLHDFTGSGSAYTAIFIPASNTRGLAQIQVASLAFSDANGNLNADGMDSDNQLTLTLDTIPQPSLFSASASGLGVTENINIVFKEDIFRSNSGGTAQILLQAAGKTVEAFKVSSAAVTITGNVLTLNPTKSLNYDTEYSVVIGSGALSNTSGSPNEVLTYHVGTTDTLTTETNKFSLPKTVNKLAYIGVLNFTGTGNSNDNVITSSSGNDTLDGGLGNDTLIGGGGDDTYVIDSAGDVVVEAANGGNDTAKLLLTSGSYTLSNFLENAVLVSKATNFTLTGNGAANSLTGNNSANILNGLAGDDVLIGGGGADTFLVKDGFDSVRDLGNGADVIQVAAGGKVIADVTKGWIATADSINDGLLTLVSKGQSVNLQALSGSMGVTLTNVGGGATLTATNRADTLIGGQLNDILNGGDGSDILTGGQGKDRFVFDTPLNANSNLDTLTDFTSGTDKLVLSKSVFTAFGSVTKVAAEDLFSADDAQSGIEARDRLVYDTRSGELYYDADGVGGNAAMLIAVIGNHATLTSADFILA